MKKTTLAALLLLLAGCAAHSGLREVDLRDPEYFRTERTIPLTFPKIQSALFKHQAACGSGPVFAMDARETAYATITSKPDPSAGWEDTILVDLVGLQEGYLADARSKAKVYTYRFNNDIARRIDDIFRAMTHPDQCPGAPAAK